MCWLMAGLAFVVGACVGAVAMIVVISGKQQGE